MALITWNGPATVQCVAETTCPPDCKLMANRLLAYHARNWPLFEQLEELACAEHDSRTSAAVCGWSGQVDVESNGHEQTFRCPRCGEENVVPVPDDD